MPVLPTSTRLSHKLAFGLNLTPNRAAIGHLRGAHIRLYAELPPHAIDDHLQVQLPHAGDDRLAGIAVRTYLERRILFAQPAQRLRHLVLIALALRLHRYPHNRIREADRLQEYRPAAIGKRIAGGRIPQPDGGDDVPRAHTFFNLLALVGVHP